MKILGFIFTENFWFIFLLLVIIGCLGYLVISNLLEKQKYKKKTQIKFKIQLYKDIISDHLNEIKEIKKEIYHYSFREIKKIDTAYLQISELNYHILKLQEDIKNLEKEYERLK